MAYSSSFRFAPGAWFPYRDADTLFQVCNENLSAHQGSCYENPAFRMQIVFDVHNYFVMDLLQRIRQSDVKNEKLVLILPSPENPVYITLSEVLNKYSISCRNVHVFFLYEYANEKGEVAPWESPYSRSGHFMRYFYLRLKESLRMPMEQIHFFTKENVGTYSDELAALGGADAAYTSLSWSGGIGAIDPYGFPASDMDEFAAMGSRLVTPMPEMLAHDSLRGMFGCSGDISDVPPCAATVGPRDLMAAKEWIDVEYLAGCGGATAHQKFPMRLALLGPVCPENPGSLMRLHAGVCYVSEQVAAAPNSTPETPWLAEELEKIRQREESKGEE